MLSSDWVMSSGVWMAWQLAHCRLWWQRMRVVSGPHISNYRAGLFGLVHKAADSVVLRAARGQDPTCKSFSHFDLPNFATVPLAKLSHTVKLRVKWKDIAKQHSSKEAGIYLGHCCNQFNTGDCVCLERTHRFIGRNK